MNYTAATFDGLTQADLADGVSVEVEGSLSAGTFMAQEIRPDDSRRYLPGTEDDIEFVGPVSVAFNQSIQSFTANGIKVLVNSGTQFDGLAGPNDLVAGILVQVEGVFEADGSVTAEEIELREAESEIKGGPAEQFDYSKQQLSLGGVLVQITPLTIITDEDDIRLSLVDLESNNELEIGGIERIGDGGQVFLEALKIELEDEAPEGKFELVGRIAEMVNDRIEVLGVDLYIVTDTDFDRTSRSQLQQQFDDGERPLVEVEYEFVGTRYVIDEIELEEGDDD